MFLYADHSLIYASDDALAFTTEGERWTQAEWRETRRKALIRDGLLIEQGGFVEGEREAHRLQAEQGPCLDPRMKGETAPLDLDRDDHPRMVDSEEYDYASAWNRTRTVVARYDATKAKIASDIASWKALAWPNGKPARTKTQGKALDRLIKRRDTLGDLLDGSLTDIERDTGYRFAYPTHAWTGEGELSGEVTGYEWDFNAESALHLTTTAQLDADRMTADWLLRDDIDLEREAVRNAAMAPKDDEADIPTRQGGQYTGTLETEFGFLLHRVRDLRGKYSEMLAEAMAAGFTKDKAKRHAQLVYVSNEAQAMVDRFNARRYVNALEQLKEAPDFPSAWERVMARKAETGTTYAKIVAAYERMVAYHNDRCWFEGEEYIGVEGRYTLPTRKSNPDNALVCPKLGSHKSTPLHTERADGWETGGVLDTQYEEAMAL